MNMSKKILIYIEKSNNVSVELAMKAQELANKLGDAEIIGLAIDSLPSGKSYFDKVFYVNNQRLKNYSSELYSKIAIDLINEIKPDIVLLGATSQGRDLAPQIAAALKTGLTADCTELDINENGKLAATRPTFGGKLMATILSKYNPQMATVRPNVITTNFNVSIKDTEYIEYKPCFDNLNLRVNLIDVVNKEVSNSLENAEVIVAGGKGVKDNLDLLYKLAEKLNGEVAVSRALVDIGLADSSIQIGQTGKSVSPKLYIACGISGAMQHVVGIIGAKKIIAINKDKDAPIFKYADFGVVGDAVEILQGLIDNL